MELHICKNCSLIEQTINNEFKKYMEMINENRDLRQSLISANDELIKSILKVADLSDGLATERQRSFKLFLQQETAIRAVQSSVNVRVNYDNNENKTDARYKRVIINSIGTTPETNNKMKDSKYNELIELMDEQRQGYEVELEFYQLRNKECIDKLKNEIDMVKSRSSVIVEKYERVLACLMDERNDNMKLRKSLRTTINDISQEFTKKLESAKNQIATEANRKVYLYAGENLNMLQQQLAERDKLVSQLRRQLLLLEDIVKEQESGFKTELDKYQKANEDLRRGTASVQEKYAKLVHRRQLEARGFFADIKNIKKELGRIKHNIGNANLRNKTQGNLKVIERQVNDLRLALHANYYGRK